MSEVTSQTLLAALNQSYISDMWDMIYSNRTGLLALVGANTIGGGVTEGYKYTWLNTRVDATGSETTAEALAAATTISVTDGTKFRAGMLLSPEDSNEVILVTAVSGNDLTVTRGFGGTTAADIASGDNIIVDSVGREENSLAETDNIYQPTPVENYYQTMDTAIEMSRRSLATLQHGNTNDLDFQLNVRLRQLATQLDRALIRGRRATATIGGKERTYMGGTNFYLDQLGAQSPLSFDASANDLTLDMINNVNAEIVKRGGTTDTIVVGIDKARELNALVSANYSSQRLQDWSTDEGSLNRLPSDLPLVGNVTNIVIDTNVNANEIMLLDSNMIGVHYMPAGNADESGAWRTLDATANGQDGAKVRILGDFVAEIRQHDTHMGRITNLK